MADADFAGLCYFSDHIPAVEVCVSAQPSLGTGRGIPPEVQEAVTIYLGRPSAAFEGNPNLPKRGVRHGYAAPMPVYFPDNGAADDILPERPVISAYRFCCFIGKIISSTHAAPLWGQGWSCRQSNIDKLSYSRY